MDDNRKLYEYFAVVGLKENAEDLVPAAQECGCRNSAPLAPITDICVIFPGLGETVPEGFEIIDSTQLGYPADLNHGSLRAQSAYICFRRGYHKAPLVDIGVLDEGRGEKSMLDSNIVSTTPFGHPANVNNSSQALYLTFRRAQLNSAPSQLVVMHICVILTNKGEIPPHTYYKIPKNLNKGMVGSEVYLCYKKSQGTSKRIAFKPVILDSFPKEGSFRLSQNIPMFCLPTGALIECWPARCQPPDKSFSTFVLTDQNGSKFYGSSVTFCERYRGKLNDEQLDRLEMSSSYITQGAVEDSTNTNDPAEEVTYYCNKAICIISRYPFFNAFKRFLFYLYRISISSAHSVPIERYLSHLMYEVSFPSPRCPRVLVQLGNETISFESYDDKQLPLYGAALFDTLKCLGPDNLMYLVLLALLEQKILVHSLRPWLLTAVAESVCALIFPFHWQCPYIPQCPLSLAGVLHAPLPFIAGVDSRYFDLYEDPPSDVTCFDLDTSTISVSTARQSLKLSILPRKVSRQLRNDLEKLYRRLFQEEFDVIALQKSMDFMPLDVDYQIQRKRRISEINIQDVFLKFMAALMQGYTTYLRPIRSEPTQVGATDTGSLFDVGGFLRTRDKSSMEFYKRFCETQSFNRFIEERSFVSDKNAYNAFFDDCIKKLNSTDNSGDASFLDIDSPNSNQTEFTTPLEPFMDSKHEPIVFKYEQFPRKLDTALFQLDKLNCKTGVESSSASSIPTYELGSALFRTKQESRNALEIATHNINHSLLAWPKTLLFYAYSIWFMLLPSLLRFTHSKRKILRLALHVLHRLEICGVTPLDQVCYRIVIQLCGDCDEPLLAVQVLQAMQRNGLEQNAVTYGIYHHAVLKASWPTGVRLNAIRAWNRLAIVFRACTILRQSLSSLHYEVTKQNQVSCSESNIQHDSVAIGLETFMEQNGEFQDSIMDPLGADAVNSRISASEHQNKTSVETMSPSRAQFIKEHSRSPFSYPSNSESSSSKSTNRTSWFRNITNSPIVSKILRSGAAGTFDTASLNTDSSMKLSPTISSLVSHVKKGYGTALQDGSFSSRIRHGVSSLVGEMKYFNRTHAKERDASSSSSFQDDCENPSQDVDFIGDLFLLDFGDPKSGLISNWWVSDITAEFLDGTSYSNVTIASCTMCPNCKTVIYDEDLMAGWSIDESNLNTNCYLCNYVFVPSLTVKMYGQSMYIRESWYSESVFCADGADCETTPVSDSSVFSQISVPFVSPLVLRREFESLLTNNFSLSMDQSLKISHPIVFWNLLYYTRRLCLPTHLPSWLGRGVNVRCVYDVPEIHTDCIPLYLVNPEHKIEASISSRRSVETYTQVTEALQLSSIYRALLAFLVEHRFISGDVKVRPHFPFYRDIQFLAIDQFGHAVNRYQLDFRYRYDYDRLPPRTSSLLTIQDKPQQNISIACRRIFLPLDLV